MQMSSFAIHTEWLYPLGYVVAYKIQTMKPEIYESLHVINTATQQITEHIEKLKAHGLLTPHYAELRALAAQQTCVETNHSAILSLIRREQDDAVQLEKQRLEMEDRLKSS